jgi:hypothetical protein
MSDLKPWELRMESDRNSDTVHNFIIFCEDEVSEVYYIKKFEKPNIKIELLGGRKSKNRQVLLAQSELDSRGQIEYTNGVPSGIRFDEGTQVWCIFDRDRNEDDSPSADTDFTTSIGNATNIGIKVAWSNDAFELWILLHFEEVNPTDARYRNRIIYYERLTQILVALPDKTEYLTKKTANGNFNYKDHFKSKNSFIQGVLPIIAPHMNDAIKRAKLLEAHHANKEKCHEMAPCTMMHKLVEELIKLSE